jgi:hypothetical protein
VADRCGKLAAAPVTHWRRCRKEFHLDEKTTITGFKPPYLSFQTFWSFVSKELPEKPLPPSIDRSMLDKKSGTDQANLLAALKGFGLVEGDTHDVQESLQMLVEADEEQRKHQLAALVRQYYPGPLSVSEQNGTEKNLFDCFENDFGMTGDTRRKAVTFFLHAARNAGIPLSPHFPATRSGPGVAAGSKAKRITKRKADASSVERPSPPAAATNGKGDTYTVNLNSGGTVSVVVAVNLFDLSTDDREYVIDLVDKLKDYEPAGAVPEGGNT